MGQLGAHSFERSPCPANILYGGWRQAGKLSSLKKPLLPKWAPESRAIATIHVVNLVTVDSKVQMSPHSYGFPRHVIRYGKADSVLLTMWVGKSQRTLNSTVYTSLSCPQVIFHSCLLLVRLICLNYLTILKTSTLGPISRRVENLYSKNVHSSTTSNNQDMEAT